MKEVNSNSAIIIDYFNTPLLTLGRTARQKKERNRKSEQICKHI